MQKLAVVALLLAGCGADPSGQSGSDGGLVDDGGGSPPGADLAAPTAVGFFTMVSNNLVASGTPYMQSVVSAQFERLGPGAGVVCTTITPGACTVTSCDVPHPDGGAPPAAVTPVSAGVVTISGGARTVTLTPNADDTYPAYSDSMHTLWSGGETLAISTAGGDVPAFQTSLTAPAQVTVASPAFAQGTTLSIDRTVDLVFQWSGGGANDVRAGGSASFDDGSSTRSVSISCAAHAASGQLTVPSSLLAMMPSGGTGSLFVESISSVRTQAGEFAIFASALSYGRAGDGSQAVLSATVTR